MSTLGISIVTYNTDEALLRSSLGCIMQSNIAAHVFIVDNSPEDSLREVCSEFSCEYYHNPLNPGYGAAHNIAIKHSIESNFDYHLVLNADVTFKENVLREIVDFMNINPRIGHVMPKVLNPDGSVQRLCKLVPTPLDLLLRRFMPKPLSIRARRNFELWDSGYDNIMFVPYLSGCFMFLRCSALKEVGAFDDRFFMYPEDIDLTRRMSLKYDTIFFPNVSVVHEHGAASYKSVRMLLIHMFNIFKYFNKWGWFFDSGRRELNEKTLRLISEGKNRWSVQ
jgi:GT2 family glycosyltransferase